MARRKRGRDLHGILLFDKPAGGSSNQVMQRVRRSFDANKAGHTGSLDPLATGMLPICFGEATLLPILQTPMARLSSSAQFPRTLMPGNLMPL